MPAIVATEISRRFGAVQALNRVSLAIRRGEFFSLLGPSGCGKTTLLRIVAGLDFPDAGKLELNGADLLPIPAHRRPVNTVFQSYALFPHLTVRENIAFGLKMKKVSQAGIADRVRRVMDLVQVKPLETRKPHQLSGGQKQRVALARAIVNEPEVLLLDEPLGALDIKLRRELQAELHALQRRLGITFIHVTHDQDEALGLSDRLAVMDHGVIAQAGTPDELYQRPRNTFVAQFVGGCNLIPAARGTGEAPVATTPLGPLRLNAELPADSSTLAIRPERIVLGDSGPNRVDALVRNTIFTGPETHVLLSCCGIELKAVMVNSGATPRPAAGERLTISLPPEALLPLEASAEAIPPGQ